MSAQRAAINSSANSRVFTKEDAERVCCSNQRCKRLGASILTLHPCSHDHNNDFAGTVEGVRLAYGRKSG